MAKIRICKDEDCKNAATTAGFCRLHFLKNWKELKEKANEGPINEHKKKTQEFFLNKVNDQMLSVFDPEETRKRFVYLGVCMHSEDVIMDDSYVDEPPIYKNFRVQYRGAVDAYLLSPDISRNGSFCEYWYHKRQDFPVQLYVGPADLEIHNFHKTKSGTKSHIFSKINSGSGLWYLPPIRLGRPGYTGSVVRGKTMGCVKESGIVRPPKPEYFDKIQRFPYGGPEKMEPWEKTRRMITHYDRVPVERREILLRI